MTWWKHYGWRFNPFVHLDAARDPHLLEYLVWPEQVDLQARGSAVVLAPPGGGKTALRVALTQYALQTYGAVAPVLVVPEEPSTHPEALWKALVRGVARRTFWQALQFFGILPWHEDPTVVALLTRLWRHHLGWPWGVLVTWLHQGRWDWLDFALGPAPPRKRYGVADFLASITPRRDADERPAPTSDALHTLLHEGLVLLRERLGARQVWILLDGLDGFPETQSLEALAPALEPIFERSEAWSAQGIYVKAFLPRTAPRATQLLPLASGSSSIAVVELHWSRAMLIRMLQARIRAASQGLMDSLDPLAHPDLRPVEVCLVERLPEEKVLPREAILRVHLLLEAAQGQPLMPQHWQALERFPAYEKPVLSK